MILMPGMMSDYSWDMGKFWSPIPQWPTFICSLVVCDNLAIVVPFKSIPKVSTIFDNFRKKELIIQGVGTGEATPHLSYMCSYSRLRYRNHRILV